MKTSGILTFVLSLGLLTSCQVKKDDPEILKKVLTDWFDGIKTQDLNKLNSLTTNDFVLFEDGRIWTNDSLVRTNPRITSITRDWTFDFVKVEIHKESGDMIYYNHGVFVINDTIQRKPEWLESATFKKVDGNWKLKFLHSTRRR
jgi:ketosteroid isomerase-like protein